MAAQFWWQIKRSEFIFGDHLLYFRIIFCIFASSFVFSQSLHSNPRRSESITDMSSPSGPLRRRSTSHSRQCPGTLLTGGCQVISSLSGPACTFSFSVVGGFTGNASTKTTTRWGSSDIRAFSPSDAGGQKSVLWFWSCREMNFGCRGPSGEEPFTQRLMSVKRGSELPVKLQPLLMPLETM